jgi:hypothetical protein
MDWTVEGGNASSSGSRRGVQWADRVASATGGVPAPLVSYSPWDLPSNEEEPRRDEDYPQLLSDNKSEASSSGFGGRNYGREEYLGIASASPHGERDIPSERAIARARYEEYVPVPASNLNNAWALDDLARRFGDGRWDSSED